MRRRRRPRRTTRPSGYAEADAWGANARRSVGEAKAPAVRMCAAQEHLSVGLNECERSMEGRGARRGGARGVKAERGVRCHSVGHARRSAETRLRHITALVMRLRGFACAACYRRRWESASRRAVLRGAVACLVGVGTAKRSCPVSTSRLPGTYSSALPRTNGDENQPQCQVHSIAPSLSP